MRRLRPVALVGLLGAALVLSACASTPDATEPDDATSHGAHGAHGSDAQPGPSGPLRDDETYRTLEMPAAYTPSAPTGFGTDDYRCFLLDPELNEDAFITGIDVLPGNKDVVHHVILFRVPPDSVAQAEAKDDAEAGQGWTCFGGSGVDDDSLIEDAPWIGAWAPGGGEQVLADDVGIPLQAGSRVIMQVHYNLLEAQRPDVSSARLRLAAGDKDLAALHTMLLPAPVELPCRPKNDDGPLCDRDAAIADAEKRFGPVAQAANYLHLLCGRGSTGEVQTCDREVRRAATIRAAAGHMHLLGREIKIEVNPGTPRARTVLDLPVWDFDDQGAVPVDPVRLKAGDEVRVTCRHDQALRDSLPAFEGQQERYVVWGEGTTDEMCLGMLMVTRP